MAADTRATGGPSDASPEPLTTEEVLDNLEAAINASQWVTAGNRLDQLRRALDAERASHPPAASAAIDEGRLTDALAEELEFHFGGVSPADSADYRNTARNIIRSADVAAALAAVPPRASEPAEAGCQYKCPLTNGGHHGHAAMDADHEFVR